MNTRLCLDGRWNLLPVDTFRQGHYPLDNASWVEQDLPGHWQQHPLFAQYAGKMVYYKRFALGTGDLGLGASEQVPSPKPQAPRIWLRLNGVFYFSQAFLNGIGLGQHEGYFAPQEHEVTHLVQDDNLLIVEVDCPEEHDKIGKRLITGVFSHWDCLDPETNPGGIWRSVELLSTGPTRIKDVLLDTRAVNDARADVRFRATLNTLESGTATLRWTIVPKNFAGEVQVVTQERRLEAGEHEITGAFAIRDPRLWWTHDLGHPNCYTVTLDLLHEGELSDSHVTTFGVRRFEMKQWIARLNGVQLFIKGTNYAPGDTRIATMTRERCEHDIQLARECHMNMLRVHAHVDVPELYEVADEAGMLLWQDFPLQWLYRREILPEASRQARAMVRLLYNHPSVALWCMHNEAIFTADTRDERAVTKARQYASVFGWNWNREVLDTRLKRVAELEDPTRPVVRSSGEYAVPLVRAGTDTHFYYGWYTVYGKLRQWDGMRRRFPRNIRFVTEFGAQSFPNTANSTRFMDADIAKIDWGQLVARHQFQSEILAHWLDWRGAPSLDALVDMTQRYQAAINRFYIDRLRFHKYRPTGGIVPFMFHDPNPAVSFSVVDYWREPKRSYDALRLAFSPQYAFTLLDADSFPPGSPIDLPIYVVNDAQRPVELRLAARLRNPFNGEIAGVARELTLPADCRTIEIERLRLTPERAGVYRLELVWDCGEQLENVYEIVVE